ncbi:MAG TPA: pilus assembly protein TadG-related protein [Candidatus Obscuribacterales bacterium]
MAFGVALLILLSIIVVGLIGLVLNIGLSMYYQGKVSYVADQAAHYAAAQYCWYQQINPGGMPTVQTNTQSMVTRILSDMGLPSGTVTVTLNGSVITSIVQVNGFVLPGKGNLPGTINVQASGAADLNADQPPALVYFTFAGDASGAAVVCPSWGWYVEGISDRAVPPAPLPDINIERGYGNLYYSIANQLPSGATLTTTAPKPPGVP